MSRALVSIIGALAALAVAVAPAAAADGWSDPKKISNTDGMWPSIAVHAGKVYVAMAGAGPDGDGIFLVTNRSGAWVTTRLTTKLDMDPSIAVDDEGSIHIAFWRMRSTDCGVACSRGIFYLTDAGVTAAGVTAAGVAAAGVAAAGVTAAGGTWTVERVLQGQHILPSIALTPSGGPRIAFDRDADFGGNADLGYARRTAGGWTAEDIGADCCGEDGIGIVSLGISPTGRPSIAYARPNHGDISIHSKVGGDWRRRTAAPFADGVDPDLAVDEDGDLHLAFLRLGGATSGTWYASNAGDEGWFSLRVMKADLAPPKIAMVGDDRVAIVTSAVRGLVFRSNASGTFTGLRITDAIDLDVVPDIAMTAGGKARIVFIRGIDQNTAYPAFVRQK